MDIGTTIVQIAAGFSGGGLVTWLLKRFVKDSHEEIKSFKVDMKTHSMKLDTYSDALSKQKLEMVTMFAAAKEDFRQIEKGILEKTNQVLMDLRETKIQLAQTVEQLKDKKESDKELNGKIIWILNKIPVLENQYEEIIRSLQRGRTR